jgi:hypothetical protein
MTTFDKYRPGKVGKASRKNGVDQGFRDWKGRLAAFWSERSEPKKP